MLLLKSVAWILTVNILIHSQELIRRDLQLCCCLSYHYPTQNMLLRAIGPCRPSMMGSLLKMCTSSGACLFIPSFHGLCGLQSSAVEQGMLFPFGTHMVRWKGPAAHLHWCCGQAGKEEEHGCLCPCGLGVMESMWAWGGHKEKP